MLFHEMLDDGETGDEEVGGDADARIGHRDFDMGVDTLQQDLHPAAGSRSLVRVMPLAAGEGPTVSIAASMKVMGCTG